MPTTMRVGYDDAKGAAGMSRGHRTTIEDSEHDDLRRFVAELRERRIGLGLGLREVAEAAGVDFGTLSKIERGRSPSPSFLSLTRFARALGMPIRLPNLPT